MTRILIALLMMGALLFSTTPADATKVPFATEGITQAQYEDVGEFVAANQAAGVPTLRSQIVRRFDGYKGVKGRTASERMYYFTDSNRLLALQYNDDNELVGREIFVITKS